MRFLIVLATIMLFACTNTRTSEEKPDPPPPPEAPQPPTEPAEERTPEGAFLELIKRKKEQGIDFFAVGQEPGWSLNLDHQQVFRFETFDGIVMNTPPVPAKTEGERRTYRAEVEMGKLEVIIDKAECADVMSGNKFTHQVVVRIKRGIDQEWKEYTGCGQEIE